MANHKRNHGLASVAIAALLIVLLAGVDRSIESGAPTTDEAARNWATIGFNRHVFTEKKAIVCTPPSRGEGPTTSRMFGNVLLFDEASVYVETDTDTCEFESFRYVNATVLERVKQGDKVNLWLAPNGSWYAASDKVIAAYETKMALKKK